MNQTGSFASALGGSGALKEAMARRGIDASILDQQTPASAGGQTTVPMGVPTTNPDVGSMPSSAVTPPKEEDNELKIALKAMSGFIGSEGKLRRDVVNARSQGLV